MTAAAVSGAGSRVAGSLTNSRASMAPRPRVTGPSTKPVSPGRAAATVSPDTTATRIPVSRIASADV